MYDAQNAFLSKVVKRVADSGKLSYEGKPNSDSAFAYEFEAFDTPSELQACLDSGPCDIALDYNALLTPTVSSLALPVLNDAPLYMSVPKVQHHSFQGIIVTAVWFFSVGSLLFLIITLLGRADVCRKPDR